MPSCFATAGQLTLQDILMALTLPERRRRFSPHSRRFHCFLRQAASRHYADLLRRHFRIALPPAASQLPPLPLTAAVFAIS